MIIIDISENIINTNLFEQKYHKCLVFKNNKEFIYFMILYIKIMWFI